MPKILIAVKDRKKSKDTSNASFTSSETIANHFRSIAFINIYTNQLKKIRCRINTDLKIVEKRSIKTKKIYSLVYIKSYTE